MKDKVKNSKGIITMYNPTVESKNSASGITLIALVITIIVLLILAGIAVSMLSGENGILRQAANAKEETEEASKKEENTLEEYEIYISKMQGKTQAEYIHSISGETLNEKKDKETDSNKKSIMEEMIDKYQLDGSTIYEKESKWYVINSDWKVTEVTELIGIIEKATDATLNDDVTYTINDLNVKLTENDEQMKEILGDSYDLSKYHLAIIHKRLICHPDDNISIENLKACEQLGIYLWGDVTEDLVVDDLDYDYLDDNWTSINKEPTKRVWIEAEVSANDNDVINNIDKSKLKAFINSKYGNTYETYIDKVYEEYTDSINDKVAEGTDKTTINATTAEEIKQYIPSYDEQSWKFKIIQGDLYTIKFKGMSSYKVELCKSQKAILLLGDITEDSRVNISDMSFLDEIITASESDKWWDESTEKLADVNFDGTVDKNDKTVLQQIIDGTYE